MPDPRAKIRIRFITNRRKHCPSQQFLKGVLPALWNDHDRQKAVDSADWAAALFNANKIFFYPWALNANKTRLLNIYADGYEAFPWETPDSEIYRFCASCRAWDFGIPKTLVKPILTRDSFTIVVCPACQHIALDDVQAGKAGYTCSLTWRQLKERFGIDLHEMSPRKDKNRGICTLDVPATVAAYLDHFSPEGRLLGYWIDRHLNFCVLLGLQGLDECSFMCETFPQTVGHWGHETWGQSFKDTGAVREWLQNGLSDADEQMKGKLQSLLDGIDRESGAKKE